MKIEAFKMIDGVHSLRASEHVELNNENYHAFTCILYHEIKNNKEISVSVKLSGFKHHIKTYEIIIESDSRSELIDKLDAINTKDYWWAHDSDCVDAIDSLKEWLRLNPMLTVYLKLPFEA